MDELKEWNHLRSDRIMVGQQLRIPGEDQEWYVVKRGDSLSEIAQRHQVPLSLLRQINGLESDSIQPGLKLKLRPSPNDEGVHVVRQGETLYSISRRYGMQVDRLKAINDLDGNRIFIGQKLRLKESDLSVHIVETGDALWEIARAYGISLDELRRINGLESDRIYPGQELRLTGQAAQRLGTYKVRRGDNLTEIAMLHQMSLRELRQLNGIRGSVIYPGQRLKVRPLLGSTRGTATAPTAPDWDILDVQIPGVRRIPAPNGPYYFGAPKLGAQKSKNYFEESTISPVAAYRNARKLYERFSEEVDRMPRLGNELAGWHIVLDPGHGGIDPGTSVAAKDASGSTYYLVEDEYVYDIALRIFVLLKLHGADVTLTLLSPNHLIRKNSPQSATFVHDRNEVFNLEGWNKRNRPSTWPKGGQKYLNARVDVAREAYRGAPPDRQVFISLHADNVKALGDVVTLLYYQDSRTRDNRSRDFARKLLPTMGAGARMKGQSLGVLRRNPAHYKLLVEIRNLAFTDHIWALRYDELRQRDAEKVAQALLRALAGS